MKYIIRILKQMCYFWLHKYYVFIGCLSFEMIGQGIIHDCSKFRLSDLIPRIYYEKNKEYMKYITNRHKKTEPHHIEYWYQRGKPMPKRYVKEMFIDQESAIKTRSIVKNHKW